MAVSINSSALAREDWRKVSRLSRWTNSRRVRRIVVVTWSAVLALDVGVVFTRFHANAYAHLFTLFLFVLNSWTLQRIEIGLAHPTLEDRAALQYGEGFDALKESQRHAVLDQQVRDNLLGTEHTDAREADLRQQADAQAYRILCRLTFVFLGLALSILLWVQSISSLVLMTASAILCWIIFVLPMLIRIWIAPDQLGEPHLVEPETPNVPQ